MTSSGQTDPPPRSSRSPRRPRTIPDRAALARHNHHCLAAYANSADEASRTHWRNQLVEANLGLVHSIAARYSGLTPLPFSDLTQVGCQGLIRAVEAFDSRRAGCLSTFALPYVRGAIQHELRDRGAWIRPPRRLWELRQRAKALQDQRHGAGLPPYDPRQLAAALQCSLGELEEARILRQFSTPLSLDALQGQGQDSDGKSTWLDQLADPRSLAANEPPPCDRRDQEQKTWLRHQLQAMEPLQRDLLLGRVLLGCTWVELGRQLGLHPRMAERRCNAALRQLRGAAERWQPAQTP
ncbi:MAG: sigma-70 family RNA polymerase sigma factor [Cyanobacteriota bacterium]